MQGCFVIKLSFLIDYEKNKIQHKINFECNCLDFLRNLDKKCVHYNNFQKNLKSSNNKLNIVLVQLSVKQYTDHRLGKCVLYLHTKQETDVFIV